MSKISVGVQAAKIAKQGAIICAIIGVIGAVTAPLVSMNSPDSTSVVDHSGNGNTTITNSTINVNSNNNEDKEPDHPQQKTPASNIRLVNFSQSTDRIQHELQKGFGISVVNQSTSNEITIGTSGTIDPAYTQGLFKFSGGNLTILVNQHLCYTFKELVIPPSPLQMGNPRHAVEQDLQDSIFNLINKNEVLIAKQVAKCI